MSRRGRVEVQAAFMGLSALSLGTDNALTSACPGIVSNLINW